MRLCSQDLESDMKTLSECGISYLMNIFFVGRTPKRPGKPQGDEIGLVVEEEPVATDETLEEEEEPDSDDDERKDLAKESGLRFHLKKRS